MKPLKPWWKPILDTFLHVIVASMMFILIALPALGLAFLVKVMDAWGLPAYTLYVLTGLEYIIVTIDAGMVLHYICKHVLAHLKGGHDDDQDDEGHDNGHNPE